MKVSLKLAQEFSNVDLGSIGTPVLLQKIGQQLGSIEEVTEWGPRYDKVVVAKIVSCADHPDAAKLHVCMIDDGEATPDVERDGDGLVQVVCGAPNAREGILVAWLPPGSTVPSSYNTEPFVLGARELRGVISNGMLASPRELGVSDDHEGILEIDPNEVGEELAKPGTPFKQLYSLDDVVVDCENKMFTHRPDCFGVLGVARELAGIQGLQFKSPDWYLTAPKFEDKNDLPLQVQVDIPELVPRFIAVALNNITVAPSPTWLQAGLAHAGIKSINNVVDITNYVMQLTGQPLHAYDYDKIKARSTDVPTLIARDANDGEKLNLLNGKQAELAPGAIVISAPNEVLGIAGVMGGADTEVDASTKNIILEAATFDMYSIRRTSMRYGLFTDAVTRFNKGQSPLQNDRVVAYAMELLGQLAGGQQASNVIDIKSKLPGLSELIVGVEFINERLGSSLGADEIVKLLKNVEINAEAKDDGVHVTAPFWRMDIEQPEDIVEEVGRLYDYGKLPVVLPGRTTRPAARNKALEYKQSVRAALAAAGANEVLTYSFVHGDLMRKMGTDPEKWAYHIRNALSPSLQYYRTSLIPNLLEKVQANLRSDMVRGADNEFAIFEFGKAHVKGHDDADGLPGEMEHVALVFVADDKTAKAKYSGAAYYQAKQYLLPFIDVPLQFEQVETNDLPITAPYQIGRSSVITIGGEVVGVIGEFRASVRSALKLPRYCAGFELDLPTLQKLATAPGYQPVSNYPKIQQDITVEVAQAVEFGSVYSAISDQLVGIQKEHGYHTVTTPQDIFQSEGSDKKRVSLRIWVSHPDRTLKTSEVNSLLDTVADRLAKDFSAVRI